MTEKEEEITKFYNSVFQTIKAFQKTEVGYNFLLMTILREENDRKLA